MDDPSIGREELDESLRFIRVANRRLGGVRALVGHLRRWSARWPRDRAVTLLDVGTGSADLPVAAVRWAREAGFDLRVTGVDLHETTLELAREHVSRHGELADAIELVRADATRLADLYEPGSFDYAHAGLFLHHLSELQVLTVLRIMERLAAAGIVWNDLVRSRLALAAIRVLTLGANHVVKHDGAASVRAGFTRREVLDIRKRLDLDYTEYSASVLTQRFTLAGEKPGAWT